MMRPGIEPKSPSPLANTLTIRPSRKLFLQQVSFVFFNPMLFVSISLQVIVDLGVMAMKGIPHSPELKPHYQMQFDVYDTSWWSLIFLHGIQRESSKPAYKTTW